MLDRTSRKFLKFICKNELNMDDGLFTQDYIGDALGLSWNETADCRRFLEEKGLIRCVYIDNEFLVLKHALWGIAPNHMGRHYIEFSALELAETVLKSILLPIVVSLVTALLIA